MHGSVVHTPVLAKDVARQKTDIPGQRRRQDSRRRLTKGPRLWNASPSPTGFMTNAGRRAEERDAGRPGARGDHGLELTAFGHRLSEVVRDVEECRAPISVIARAE
jgi:hypothetical protein